MRVARWLLLPSFVTALVLPGGPAHASVPILVIDGEGHGHGVGMAQDGAYWMGRSGADVGQILGHFYPGAGPGRASGAVRVAVLDAGTGEITLTFPTGGELRSPRSGPQLPGFPVVVPPGASVRVRHDDAYRVMAPAPPTRAARATTAGITLPLPTSSTSSTSSTSTTSTTSLLRPPTASTTTTTTTAPTSTSTTAPTAPATPAPSEVERASSQPIWAVTNDATIGVPARDARYRGDLEALSDGSTLRLLNELDVEQYLRGMGEVRDPRWPAASLRAQAIVARTYALRAMRVAGELCDTQKCQVYLGQQAEYPAMDAAVSATAGQVLTYRGTLTAAVYSANGAGVSATPSEGFGTPDAAYPYLRAAPYETHSPEPWSVRIALGDLATRLRYPGTITNVAVATTGPSGRPLSIALDGTAGPRTVSAVDLTDKLSLQSTKWTPRVELGDAAPPPPPEGQGVQVLPDAVSTTVRHSVARRLAAPRDDHDGMWIDFVLVAIGLGAIAMCAAVELAPGRREEGPASTAGPSRTP
jgi:stage II sporulation protein D